MLKKIIIPLNSHDDLGMRVRRTEGSMERESHEKSEDHSESDDGSVHITKQRKGKTRRTRRKSYRPYLPYYQLSEPERIRREEREKLRVVKLMERMRAKGRVIAPYNTTQFIMADHPDDTIELLKLLEAPNKIISANKTIPEEDEEYYYFSPLDEEDFNCKEFNKDYDKQHVNNLEMMSKEMLLNEYMMIVEKNEILEARMETVKDKDKLTVGTQTTSDNAKVSQLKDEMESLLQENKQLMRSNSEIKEMLKKSSKSFQEYSDDDIEGELNHNL